jgi:phospho-N-acetylmuramoyl-pentapeptide-transferase
VTAILIAAAVGLSITLFGTPVAIRLFRLWGWGERIREDGPHTHLEKMGTPTMGGVVIILGLVGAYLVARVKLPGFTPAGLGLLLVALGLGAVGFVDDLLKVRGRRSLGLSKSAKVIGQALVALAFGIVVMRFGPETGTSTQLSFIRETGLDLGFLFYLWTFVMLTASSNAVNLTDGLDGLASGSSILVFSAYVFIAFWQWRHVCDLTGPPACYGLDPDAALDTAIVAAGAAGAAAGFLWWNAAPARIFMGDTGSLALGGLMAGLAVSSNPAPADRAGGVVRARDELGDRPGRGVPPLPPPRLPDGPDPPSLRARRVARVHGDRPVLDRGRARGGPGDRAVLRGLPRARGGGVRWPPASTSGASGSWCSGWGRAGGRPRGSSPRRGRRCS